MNCGISVISVILVESDAEMIASLTSSFFTDTMSLVLR
jgi:hypothetical protein